MAAVAHDLSAVLSPELLRCTSAVLARACEGPNVAMLARFVRLSPRTLQRLTRTAKVRSPAILIECTRVLFAARVDATAIAAGYATPSALRIAFRRCGVTRPASLHGAAAYAFARDTIRERIRGHRSATARIAVTPSAQPQASVSAPALLVSGEPG